MTFPTSARTRHLSLAFISAAFILSAGAAFAAGGGSGGGDSGDASKKSEKGKPITDMTTCPKGQVWNVKKKECTKEKADALPDDDMANYAWVLAKADRYQEALDVLNLLHDPNTAKALNYRGFATRKLGRTDEGIGYYLKSVQIDPQYAQVREYLGEAYVIKGRVDLAKDQLTTIKTICGSTECEEYEDLSAAIKGAS
jgi:tetratricopeptide (TPR) repeat protein